MARARNIKPGFFKNPELAEVSFEARLLFIGLWTLADREGYLEDRPKRIKMELFPADNADVETGLCDLAKSGFIERYTVEGTGFIRVCKFLEHQHPHHLEKPSTIPKPGTSLGLFDSTTTQKPRQDLVKTEGNPSDSLILRFSDSLNPDSLNPEPEAARIATTECAATNETETPNQAGLIAGDLRRRGCAVTGSHPLLLAWVRDRIYLPQLIEALELAKMRKPGEKIGPAYIDAIVRDPKAGKAAEPVDRWWDTQQGIDRKAKELRIRPNGSDTYETLKDKIFTAIKSAKTESRQSA